MFDVLSRVLLWLLLGTLIVSVFQRYYPSATFVGRFFLVILMLILLLAFVTPTQAGLQPLFNVVSFPLQPLGGAILLLMFGAQRIKGGAVDKPGGFYVGWALIILLIASTPVFQFLLSPNTFGRALAISDFVPTAGQLDRVTDVWVSYLGGVSRQLR